MSIHEADLGQLANPLGQKQQRFLVTVETGKQFFKNNWYQAVRQTGVKVIEEKPVQVLGDRATFMIAGTLEMLESLFAYACVVQLQKLKPGRVMRARGNGPKKARKRKHIPELDAHGKVIHFSGHRKRPKWHGPTSGDTIPRDGPACPKTCVEMTRTDRDTAVSAAKS